MHVQDIRAFEKLDLIKEKIRECGTFAVEFHLGEAKGMGEKTAMLPDGLTLKGLVPEKKYTKLRKILLKTARLDIDLFQRLSPFMLLGLVSGQLLDKDMPESLDEHLWKFAEAENKAMEGIETLAEQMAVLEKIPLGMQVKMLLDLGRNPQNFRRHLLHMTSLYQNGELQRLSKSVNKNARGLRKILLYQRNETMAGRIFHLAKKGSIFAAVGAGHLGGGKGVIRLLKKKGLKVKPVGQAGFGNPGYYQSES